MSKINKGTRIYDNSMELFAIIKECDNLKKVEVEYVGGGKGIYNLDVSDLNYNYEVKL